jgi:hypothetical protein
MAKLDVVQKHLQFAVGGLQRLTFVGLQNFIQALSTFLCLLDRLFGLLSGFNQLLRL